MAMHMAQERRHPVDDEALCGAKVNDNLVYAKADVTCWRCVHLLMGRPLPAEPKTPEHEKLKAAKFEGRDATQLIGEFLNEFLPGEGVRLAKYNDREGELYEVGNKRELIAKFFGINENALESEKMALLEYQRAMNKAVDWAEKEGRPFLAQRT